MLAKCKAILEDIYESKLWDNLPLRLLIIERSLENHRTQSEIDGSEDKAANASNALMTFTELVKVRVPKVLSIVIYTLYIVGYNRR